VSQTSDTAMAFIFVRCLACVHDQQCFLFFFCSNRLCRFFSVYYRRSQVWAPCPRFSLPSSLFLCRRCCPASDFISAPSLVQRQLDAHCRQQLLGQAFLCSDFSCLVPAREHDGGWCTWHHHGGCIKIKLKMDGSMRRAASDPATLTLLFSMY
jgi:hypothetical protein